MAGTLDSGEASGNGAALERIVSTDPINHPAPGAHPRAPRWPSRATIRAARRALEAGATLALAGRRLTYCSDFFGLSTSIRPAGVSPRQWAARQNWIRRREIFGTNGFSAKGEHALRLNLVQAAVVKARAPRSAKCRRGHAWRPETTRITAKGRSCRLCERIVRGQRTLARKARAARAAAIDEARRGMIHVGIEMHRQPLSAYWRDRYQAAHARWVALVRDPDLCADQAAC